MAVMEATVGTTDFCNFAIITQMFEALITIGFPVCSCSTCFRAMRGTDESRARLVVRWRWTGLRGRRSRSLGSW